MPAMSPVHRFLLAVAGSTAAACTVAPPPKQIADEPRGSWGERVLVEANAIPAAWIQRDTDGGAPKPDREDAAGFGARFGIGNRSQSIGVMAQMFHGDESFDAAVVGFDSDVRARLDRDWPRWMLVRAGASVGGGYVDTATEDSAGQLMAQLRFGVDFQPTERLLLQVGFGGIVFGHPGETEAYGTFVTVGGGLTF